jgi:peptide deformylase
MFSIMYNNDGVGLAAPQIGISISMFIMDSKEINEKRVVINPMIL